MLVLVHEPLVITDAGLDQNDLRRRLKDFYETGHRWKVTTVAFDIVFRHTPDDKNSYSAQLGQFLSRMENRRIAVWIGGESKFFDLSIDPPLILLATLVTEEITLAL